MSRITKAISEDVAKQLTIKKLKEINKIKDDLKSLATKIQTKYIPDEILSVYKSYPEFIKSRNYVYFKGAGLQRSSNFNFNGQLPCCDSSQDVTAKEAESLIAIQDKITDLSAEYSELVSQIELALINLRTYKNVESEFPEAFKLLPPTKTNTSLMINIKGIRCKLDKNNC